MLLNKKQIFKYSIILGCVISFVSVFLPFISMFNNSVSLWDLSKETFISYILLVFLVVSIASAFFNKKVELSYLASGSILLISFEYLISAIKESQMSYLGIGFYMFFIAGLLITVFTFLYMNINDGDLKSNKEMTGLDFNPNIAQPTNPLAQMNNSITPVAAIKQNLNNEISSEENNQITQTPLVAPIQNDAVVQDTQTASQVSTPLAQPIQNDIPVTPVASSILPSGIDTNAVTQVTTGSTPINTPTINSDSPINNLFPQEQIGQVPLAPTNNSTEQPVVNPVNELFGSSNPNSMIQENSNQS